MSARADLVRLRRRWDQFRSERGDADRASAGTSVTDGGTRLRRPVVACVRYGGRIRMK